MSSNICPHCQRIFTRRDNMLRHVNENRCKVKSLKEKKNNVHDIEQQFADFKEQTSKEIAELKEQKNREIAELKEITSKKLEEIKNSESKQVNQVLQVICVTSNDNYLDILTERMGDFGEAIEYIKDCALSDISGDCKLIEKIYMNTSNRGNVNEFNHFDHNLNQFGNIHYTDQYKNKITFFNEKKERVIETKLSMGKKLANNLQNSYLKGINHLINRNLQRKIDPNKFLEEYDILTWNSHIYNLSDTCYQKNIINKLCIPVLPDK